MSSRFDINAFHRDAQCVAQSVRADRVFSFLTREILLPSGCAALVWTDSPQAKLVPPIKPIEADGVRDILFVRTLPCQLNYRIGAIRSSDGHEVAANVTILVQPVGDRAELEAFHRRVLGRESQVSISQLQVFCEEVVRVAVAEFAKKHPAARLILPETWQALDPVLAEHFKPLGFDSGLALAGDVRASFTSAAYEDHQRGERLDADRAKRLAKEEELRVAASKAREQHLAGLAGLLDQAQALAAKSGGMKVADLIQTFDPAQRGQLYQGMMELAKPISRTREVLVVCGNELLSIDPANVNKIANRRRLPDIAGGVRSVRVADANQILVGARHGVHVLQGDSSQAQTYRFEAGPEIRGGVNAAVILCEHLYATHSEVGLIEWRVGDFSGSQLKLTETTQGAKAIRDLQTDDGRGLWLCVDERAISWTPNQALLPLQLRARSEIRALLLADEHVYAGLQDGSIVRWWVKDSTEPEMVRPPSENAVRSLAWVEGGGVGRLLVADGRSHLDLQVIGDNYRGEYRCDQPMRWGFATDDLIVGVNANRDKIVFWHPHQPSRPMGSLSIGRLTGESIQDVAIVHDAESIHEQEAKPVETG